MCRHPPPRIVSHALLNALTKGWENAPLPSPSPHINKRCRVTYSSFLMGSVVVPGFFLSMFLWDRPFRSRRKDSLSDFFNDFLLDIGLSSALAMSERVSTYMLNELRFGAF